MRAIWSTKQTPHRVTSDCFSGRSRWALASELVHSHPSLFSLSCSFSLSLSIYLSISLSLSISFFPFSWNGHSLSPTHTIHSHLCVVMPVCCCMLLLSLFVSGISSFPSSLFHFGCLPLLPLPPLCIPLFLPSYSIVFGNAYPGPGLHWHGREPKLLARGLTLRAPENLIYIYN